jgi:hypothetical protein
VLAAGMRKRTRNSSFYNVKLKTLAWRVEWVFKREDGGRAMIADERVPEDSTLAEALGMHVGPEQLRPSAASQRLQLRKYVAQFREDPSAIRYLLKIEVGTGGVADCYKELEGGVALREALKGVVLVEYPVLYVVLPGDSEDYNTKDWALPDGLLPGSNDGANGRGINGWAGLLSNEVKDEDDSDGSESSSSSSSSDSDSDSSDDDEGDAAAGEGGAKSEDAEVVVAEAGAGEAEKAEDDAAEAAPQVAPEDLPENWF